MHIRMLFIHTDISAHIQLSYDIQLTHVDTYIYSYTYMDASLQIHLSECT